MSRRRISRSHESNEEDFELNLASIIDCFVVVITYLLVSASFISIGVFDVGIPTPGVEVEKTPPLVVTVQLTEGHSLAVRLTGSERREIVIPPRAGSGSGSSTGSWDFEAMNAQLKTIKDKWPDLQAAMVSADANVEYRDVVKAIEAVREAFPSVSIGEDGGRSS